MGEARRVAQRLTGLKIAPEAADGETVKQTVALAVATLGGLASLAAGLVLVHRGVTLTDAGAWAPALLSALAIHVLALGYACLCGRAPARPHPHVPARVPVKQGRDS